MSRINALLVVGLMIFLVSATLPAGGTHSVRIDNRVVHPYGVQVMYHIPVAVGYEPVPPPVHCAPGAPVQDATQAVAAFSEDFEGAHGFTFISTPLSPNSAFNPNLWHTTTWAGIGDDAGHGGPGRLFFGRDAGNYQGGHPAGVAQSPPIELPAVGAAYLVFNTKWQVEWLKGYDHMWVEASSSDGRTHLLCSNNAVDRADWNGVNGGTWFTSCSPNIFTPCEAFTAGGLPRTQVTPMGWETRHIPIPATLMGTTIQLRFTFDASDPVANRFMGWMVDDVQLLVVP